MPPDSITSVSVRTPAYRAGFKSILHVGLRSIATGGHLGVPAAVLVLVFDDLRMARHALLGRGGAGRREGLRVGRIWSENLLYRRAAGAAVEQERGSKPSERYCRSSFFAAEVITLVRPSARHLARITGTNRRDRAFSREEGLCPAPQSLDWSAPHF
jgi:hypothetical protein